MFETQDRKAWSFISFRLKVQHNTSTVILHIIIYDYNSVAVLYFYLKIVIPLITLWQIAYRCSDGLLELHSFRKIPAKHIGGSFAETAETFYKYKKEQMEK